jgi:hypothetical protein
MIKVSNDVVSSSYGREKGYERDAVTRVEIRGESLYLYTGKSSGPVVFNARRMTPLLLAKMIALGTVK